MKKLLLFIPLLICLVTGCSPGGSGSYKSCNESALVEHFNELGRDVIGSRKNEDGTFTVVVLTSYTLELYMVSIVNGEYKLTLIKYL